MVQFGKRVRTVAVDRDAERRADAEAIADIGIVAGELAIGIEPALGVARIGLDLEVRDRVPFEVERSEEHTSELQSLMRISYAVFCLKKKKQNKTLKTNIESHIITYIPLTANMTTQ